MTIDINKVRVQLDSDSITDHIELHANDRLEAAEGERDWHADRCEDAMSECASLRAKIAEMEQQGPVAYLPLSSARILESGVIANAVVWNCRDKAASDIPLYALPGAQTQGEGK